MLLVLATSGPRAEVGLAAGPRDLVGIAPLGEGAQRGRGLLPAVERLLADAGRRATDLKGIVADVGPGSFTGTRVGVTAAKTLAMALEVPVFAVTSLRALAEAAGGGRRVLALRDAGRGRAYFAVFGPGGEEIVPLGWGDAAAVCAVQGAATPAGEGAVRLSEAMGLRGPALEVTAGAEAVLLAAAGAGPTDPHTLVPAYVQASTPEVRLAAGTQGGEPPCC
jgi:tRNA threonylcarbamoyl adenosine modification protein YeaZ